MTVEEATGNIGGVPVFRRAEVGSTMDVAAGLSREHGSGIVVADRQTRGRGRHGRAWVSEEGGLYLSWFTDGEGLQTRHLLEIAAVAVVESLAAFGCSGCLIKAPNDILYRGKKIAGLLLQMTGGRAILGIGVNLNNAGAGIGEHAVSFLDATGGKADREAFLTELVRRIRGNAGRCTGPNDDCVSAWSRLLIRPRR